MNLEQIEIVDSKGTVLVSYVKEEECFISNDSCKLKVEGDKMLLMITDYESPNDLISLVG